MANRNRTRVWLVVCSVAVLAFVGVLLLAEMGQEDAGSDLNADMTFEQALETTRSSCYAATGQWRKVVSEGRQAVHEAKRLSRRCEQNAIWALEGIPSDRWANSHCRAYVEGFRDLARWEVEYGEAVYGIDASAGTAPPEIVQEWRRAEVLMGTVRYQYDMCVHKGVVG